MPFKGVRLENPDELFMTIASLEDELLSEGRKFTRDA